MVFRKACLGLAAACLCTTVGGVTLLHGAEPDVVVYAADAAKLQGQWSRVTDLTAAGKQLLASADLKWDTAAPLAAPKDYVEFPVSAPANTAYHVWVRLRARDNSKFNDSLFLQFSDAVNKAGLAVYRIGSVNALVLNLQSANNAKLSGWGWVDGAYWLTQTPTIKFSTSGPHMLRVQTREDGVQLDQIVLSPTTFINSAPGANKNDSTIVPKSVVFVPSTPRTGTPAAIPGTIQTEDFDNGGEGIAYHDLDATNNGGQYRVTEGVDLELASEGGYDVGWAGQGEWLKYTVNVSAAGTYLFEARVASPLNGGTFHVESGTTNLTGPLAVPNTGGWQNWATVSQLVTLSAGTQTLRLVLDTAASANDAVGNFTWIRFSAPATSTAFGGTPVSLPGMIEAARFDNGPEGTAYHDTTPGNSGGAFRTTDVDIEANTEGGYNIGWVAPGEWLTYSVNVAASALYTVQFRVASPSTGTLHAQFGGVATPPVIVPNTGYWQNWTNVSVQVTLPAGPQLLKVIADGGELNLASITVTTATTDPAPSSPSDPTPAPAPPVTEPPPPSAPASDPAPPPTTTTSSTITVTAGGNLQAAIDTAQPGDTILLEAGATFIGNFTLPVKSGASYITIRSAAPDAQLPGPGVRMNPSYAPLLPKVKSPNSAPAMATEPGAHHYKLMLLEFPSTAQPLYDIVTLGDGSPAQNSLALVPYELVLDRLYVHGDAVNGQKRGVALNSASTSVLNSYIVDMKVVGQDSQAVGGWNGPGPFTIENNYLEAAGENILFGGADPSIANLVPSDIVIRRNYLSKPLAWMSEGWSVKNLLELKNAQRVVIDGNLIENNWMSGQSGPAVLFTPRNQGGTAPWSVVQHVQFTNNIVRHVSGGFNILARDNNYPSQETNDIVIRNNIFEDISSARYGGWGGLVLINGGHDIVFDHNTAILDGSWAVFADGSVQNFVFTNNIIPDNNWAIMGTGLAPGTASINFYFPGSTIRSTIIAGPYGYLYPTGNYFPTSMDAVGFVNLAGGNYRLSSASLYRNAATDGTDVGCDIGALNAAAGSSY